MRKAIMGNAISFHALAFLASLGGRTKRRGPREEPAPRPVIDPVQQAKVEEHQRRRNASRQGKATLQKHRKQ